ncbi:J domain-containing protein [Salininema proteolyticum]|uniref:J domain-containing protein n=1 Tax=Salininema proteolyticum TaxID=1607685 RepID=A0ABV8TUN1_9ACTN
MRRTPEHYRILGLTPNADADDIKNAWRKTAQNTHPDRGGDPDTFHRAAKAHRILSDPHSRAEYDAAHLPPRKRRTYRPRHRDTNTYNLTPSTTTDIATIPWHHHTTHPHPHPTPNPLLWTTTLALTATTFLTSIAALLTIAAPTGLLTAAATLPLALAASTLTITTTLSSATRHNPHRPPRTRPHHLLIPLTTTTTILTLTDHTHPATWTLATATATATLLPHTARRTHYASTMWKQTKDAARNYNTFAPPGPRPTLPTHTEQLFKEILTHLPATKLFLNLPAADHTTPYALLTGTHLALITTTDHTTPHHTAHTITTAATTLQAAYPTLTITTHLLHHQNPAPTTPPTLHTHHLHNNPATKLGNLLTPHQHHLDTRILYLLRHRLTTTHTNAAQPI